MAGILRGDIVWANLDPTIGNEQRGLRPVLIPRHDVFICILLIFIVFITPFTAYSVDYSFQDQNKPVAQPYHHVEIAVGIGFLWLTQVSITVLPCFNLYCQAKASNSILIEDYCLSLGYQHRLNDLERSYFRCGLGYSYGKKTNLVFGEGENAEPDKFWNGCSLQAGGVFYFSKYFGWSFMGSVLVSKPFSTVSLNVAILFVFF